MASFSPLQPPFLLNPWKHHLGMITGRLEQWWQEDGREATLRHVLLQIGTRQMDLYTGVLDGGAIADEIKQQLQHKGVMQETGFRYWVRGYRLIDLSDHSCWVLREGDDKERYIHVHPARYTPLTVRVRANVLKTAILAFAISLQRRKKMLGLPEINKLRQDWLQLAPLRRLDQRKGAGRIIRMLKERMED